MVRSRPPSDVIGSDAHRSLALDASTASMVLLRNQGPLLPLDPSAVGRVAVLGRLAAIRNLGDGGSSDVRSTEVVTHVDGLRERFGADRVTHHDTDASIAADADVAVVVVGYTKADEGECIDAPGAAELAGTIFPPSDHPELGTDAAWVRPPGPLRPPASAGVGDVDRMAPGGDRASLRLSAEHEALIAAARAVNDNVIVVVVSGAAVVMPWASTVPAVLMAWYSGVEGGTALAAVLAGDAEPAGRLPFVVPVDPAHLPDFDRDATAVTHDLFHGQWKLDRDGHPAHFPFGWGLGYGTVQCAELALAGPNAATLTVRNPGERATSAVVFVHAGIEQSAWERPARRLIGFARVSVPPGESVDVSVDLDWSMLDVRAGGRWITEEGTYLVEAGRHAHDAAALTATVDRTRRVGDSLGTHAQA